jgi:hypothetical protein
MMHIDYQVQSIDALSSIARKVSNEDCAYLAVMPCARKLTKKVYVY